MMVTAMTNDAVIAYITRQYGDAAPAVVTKVNTWLARGDGLAIYENHDLGHRDLGLCQLVSYGSSSAQLETDTPPERLPDIGNRINWRYVLVHTYRGDVLDVPPQPEDGEDEHDPQPGYPPEYGPWSAEETPADAWETWRELHGEHEHDPYDIEYDVP